MAEAKHTKGPVCIETPMDDLWIVKANQQSYEWDPLATVALEYGTGITKVEARANAALIVEAFNVATEAGMTPRQLQDELNLRTLQRDRLRAALAEIETWLANGDYDTRGGLIEMDRLASVARAAIAKATGEACPPPQEQRIRRGGFITRHGSFGKMGPFLRSVSSSRAQLIFAWRPGPTATTLCPARNVSP